MTEVLSQFKTGNDLTKAIHQIVSNGHADLAVAFWGDRATDLLGIPCDASNIRIVCDAWSGCCNPNILAELLDRNCTLVDVPHLHAKVYIGDGSAIVASANASTNGLGEEGIEYPKNYEAGYIVTNPVDVTDAREWFEAIFRIGTPINEDDIPQIRKIWREKRKNRPVGRTITSFLEVLQYKPEYLEGRGLKVAIYKYEDPPERIERKYRESAFYDKKYDGSRYSPYYFEAYSWNINSGDYILDVGRDENGNYECEGVWKVLSIINNKELIPTELIRQPFSLSLSVGDKKLLAAKVKLLVDSKKIKINGPLLSIRDFAKIFAT